MSRKPTLRTVALIPFTSAAREARQAAYGPRLIVHGTAIVLASTPPTKKEPLRRKLALRIVPYAALTKEGVARFKEIVSDHGGPPQTLTSDWYEYRNLVNCGALNPDYVALSDLALKNIPLNDNSIDQIIDGLITAKEFLAGASESIA